LDRQRADRYAKSIMDYIFRWLQLRFLSGHQLPLFAGLATPAAATASPAAAPYPVEGTIGDLSASSAIGVPYLVQPGAEAAAPNRTRPRSRRHERPLHMGDAPSCHTLRRHHGP